MSEMGDGEGSYARGIDLAGVRRTWPDGRDLPDLVNRFATYLRAQPFGCVGWLTMGASRIDDYWIDRGADLWPQFGMFLQFADGSQLAVWFHDGATDGAEPVVLLGSEGDLQVVAPNLKAFVTSWAAGVGPFELARPEHQGSPWLDDVARGLGSIAEAAPEPPASAPVPNLEAFFASYEEHARALDLSDPTLREIAALLAAHAPKGAASWTTNQINVAIAGDRVEFLGWFERPRYESRRLVPERGELVPLIHRVREARVTPEHVARGLWHSATIKLSTSGRATVAADWEAEPKFETGGRVTRTEIEADLARYPRGARWRPPWMDELI